MTRRTAAGLVVLVAAGLAVTLWLMNQYAVFPPGETEQAMPGMPGMTMKQKAKPMEAGPGKATPAMPGTDPNTIVIAPERLQTIGVKFEPAARRVLEKVIRTVGRVEVDERRLARVNIKFHGWIEELHVSAVGDHVRKGQVLFTIYSPDLVATQEEYLLSLRSYKELGGSEFPEVARGAKDLLDATRRRFSLWDITDDHVRDLERTGQVLKTLPIHSPITGTVIQRKAFAGSHVDPGEELYTIADLSRIWVMADIYEYELPSIKIGQGADVTLSYDPKVALHGHVEFIYPTMDPKTRTAKVRFVLDNPNEKLKPDMYANVGLKVGMGTHLAIPRDAVLESGERQIVFIHRGGGKLEWRQVKLGARVEDWVEVTEGLSEGEHVVTSANFLIDSESQLRSAIDSMGGMGMK